MARSRSLPVWLEGARIGELSTVSKGGIRFAYDDSVLDTTEFNAPLLSCSLPVISGRMDARPYFAGLLPEGDARRALAARAGVLSSDAFGLLAAYGQDVAGAVVVGDQIAERPRAAAVPYTDRELTDEVLALSRHELPLGVRDDSELSLAGVQDKMLVVEWRGDWARPVHGYPSTHILKVDDRAHRGLVAAEHACLALAREAGLPASQSELASFDGVEALIVRRFDRVAGRPMPRRIHQEDACQALGIDLERHEGRAKYESPGGPNLRRISALLGAWGEPDDMIALLDQVVFTVLIGNADAHGKNVALLHPEPSRIALAPIYDTVPTALWPNLRTRAAMSIGAAVDLPDITSADIAREARMWGLREERAIERVREVSERILAACDAAVLPDHEISARVLNLVRGNARRLLEV